MRHFFSTSDRYINEYDFKIALMGNPNVGKSTIFNALTGMNQHTGNWPGKTVSSADGYCKSEKYLYKLIDLPGTYSLMAHSPEEEIARDFVCFEKPDAAIIVCDATCLERNLNLALQINETGIPLLICINLMDEAERKGIKINTDMLEEKLCVPIIKTVGKKKSSVKALLSALDKLCENKKTSFYEIEYPYALEKEINSLAASFKENKSMLQSRFIALKLLKNDSDFIEKIKNDISYSEEQLRDSVEAIKTEGIEGSQFDSIVVSAFVKTAEKLCKDAVTLEKKEYNKKDRTIDRILTGRTWAFPIMLVFLSVVFWITIFGANYPSSILSSFLFMLEGKLEALLIIIGTPSFITNALAHGVYRVLAWVVSVMLPPMAIFFPFFTLLEDSGYLPRIAYNLDRPFKCSGACGKQALTMCMGFGCNAAGVVGCRIIDSKRERLLAILTNSFVPCNGRFPTIIAIITMFIAFGSGFFSSIVASLLLTAAVILGILMTFAATKLLSSTIFRGEPSSFALELPPYRRPDVGRVIIRSVFDRTLFVLGRAIVFAAPAGLVIWLLANISFGGSSLLSHCASFLDPFGRLLGMDGAIILAFILGLPANEIVIPIIIMIYLSSGTLIDISDQSLLKTIFIENGWTLKTAISMIIFTLFHWPCSTTLMSIKKETGSFFYTLVAFALPSLIGISLCLILNLLL